MGYKAHHEGNPALVGDAQQSTVTVDGKSHRTNGKRKNLPWEISTLRGDEKSAAGIVSATAEKAQIFKTRSSYQVGV